MMEYTVNYKSLARCEIFDSMDEMSAAFFHLISDRIIESRIQKKNFSIALSGGSTPVRIYEYLSVALKEFPFLEDLIVFWGDERCVLPGDPESNFGNAWDALFSKIKLPKKNIHRIRGEDNPEEESLRYEELLSKLPVVDGFPVIDLVILGVGDDGHTASIFPGQEDLLSTDNWISPAVHPVSGQKRLTLTGKVLNNAREVLFLATGENKQKVINEIFHDHETARNYPAWHIRPRSGRLTWFMDVMASKGIK